MEEAERYGVRDAGYRSLECLSTEVGEFLATYRNTRRIKGSYRGYCPRQMGPPLTQKNFVFITFH